MKYTTAHNVLLAFTTLYILFFSVYYLQDFNLEFLAYIGLLVGILLFVVFTHKKVNFSLPLLSGLSLWGLLHMMGGSLQTSDGVLYAYRIYPFFDGGGEFYILKFDQVVHAALYAVVGLMFFHVFRYVFQIKGYTISVAFLSIMAALGVSAVNEIVEFIAVILVPDNGVGGYYNTALDIVFNALGATIAVLGRTLTDRMDSQKKLAKDIIHLRS